MKQLARFVFLAGALGIGLFLFRAAPRDVTLVYTLTTPGARRLEVEIDKGGTLLRRAEFRLDARGPDQIAHRVRLTDGRYLVRLTVLGDGPTRHLERSISITESGTVVLPLPE
ncbi:MAG TPA: hypothetical protein VMG32_09835 [Anaeromyxobacteraceae bacterium]|nr:hypothetical protein [Anaeromyxobacteraceae bacterium]